MGGAIAEDKSLERWIWDAACSIRGAQDAPKFKDYILPLVFAKRLCDVFDDEINRIAARVGTRAEAFELVKHEQETGPLLSAFSNPQILMSPSGQSYVSSQLRSARG